MGQLVAFAGHRPTYDATLGAAGEVIRRTRPDAVLLDTTLPHTVMQSCLDASQEAGTRVILTSSSSSATELAAEAEDAHCAYFVLPGGAKKLEEIIRRSLVDRRTPPRVELGLPRLGDISLHPALCAALAGVARARAIAARTRASLQQSPGPRLQMPEIQIETRRSLDALRAAVADFTTQLKSSTASEFEVISGIRSAVSACATVVGAEEIIPEVLRESEEWVREAYRAD